MSNQFSRMNYLGADKNFADSNIVLLGLPFDGTSSYLPGSRFAPNAIRQASQALETYSPYQGQDIESLALTDVGDIELPLNNTEKVLTLIKNTAHDLLKNGKRIISLGGEHLVSLPVVEAYYDYFPDLRVIQLDAHADLRDDYLDEKLSHATVMRRIADKIGFDNLFQAGIRSGDEAEWTLGATLPHFHPYNLDAWDDYLAAIAEHPIYLTLDLDILDPGCLPGTGTPEPGGIDFNTLLDALLKLKDHNLVGADIVELNPHNDQSGCSAITAAKLVRELALLVKAFN